MSYKPDLDEAAARELESVLALVTRPESVDEVTALTLANIYLKRGQHALAIEVLENSGIHTQTVFQALGDLYRFEGKNHQQARDNYMKAIDKASDVGDGQVDGQVVVLAKAGLAKMAAANRDKEAVESLRGEARAIFQELKDPEKWDAVEQRLSESDSEERTLVFLGSCPNCDFFGGDGRISGGNVCGGC